VGYAVGAADLCAASLGAPHIRQRLFWVANPASKGRRGGKSVETRRSQEPRRPSTDLRADAWPDGFGGGSTLGISEVLSPSHGLPGRVGLLRGYGNAIVPQVAAEFVKAFDDTISAND
jgi:DNA (cytosine-5)-methyltransferase 1